ncbi:LysR family transcriptional regulator [Bacterioplanes sanyensis]|uniref:LysR family transcriptional regulator n=1 Tax=Bacterioplanes sanyensis TaxID=1249553 RepID=A0A222FHI3_9GAMM|nr:LysR family transcriptional regulator [Bacterioplanes sanyensis]ASP37871.1 LysR family transcriptional regulator [Bacterioplanes sanyensis]
MNLAKTDLNLFVVFDVIYQEGNLTRASERLHLSQPAVSHALARLRERFNDPLFERSGKHMVPTPLAKAIIERVRLALAELESTFSEGLIFEPSHSSRQFTLAMRDLLEATALPALMSHIQPQAPGIQLRSVRQRRRDLSATLRAGSVDFAADVLLPVASDIDHQRIGEQQLAVLLKRDHPALTQPWDADTYLGWGHILVSSRPDGPGVEDLALNREGLERRIALRCQNYYAALKVAAETGLLLTLPTDYAHQLAQEQPQQWLVKPFPVAAAVLEVHLYWHQKALRDPALAWLQQQILTVLQETRLTRV